MNEKVEGTLVLDGLLEGKIPRQPGAESRLREWIAAAACANLRFSLEIEGGSFSILADNKPIPAEELAPSPAERIAAALRELLKVFAPEERRSIFSTLRSLEYREGAEVQTMYAIGPDGTIHVRERTVEARTAPVPRPLGRREKLRIGVIGLVVALLVFLVSSVFVDYREVLDRVLEAVVPLDAAALKVETGGFADYFTVEKKAFRGGKAAVVTLQRSEAFPLDEAGIENLLAKSGNSLSDRLTIEALARGYVRCEYFGKKNKFLGFTTQRISGLREKETIELVLPLPGEGRLARIVITY